MPSKESEWMDAPILDLSSITEAEERDAGLLTTQLAMLAYYPHKFDEALKLIDHCADWANRRWKTAEEIYRPIGWADMAAFYAAFVVYHFRCTLYAISDRVGHCPSIKAAVDTRAIHDAIERFQVEFPDAKHVRDAAGHFADRMFKPSDIDDHAIGGHVVFGQIWKGDFVFSHRNEMVALEMSDWTTERLNAIKRQVYEAFSKLVVSDVADRSPAPVPGPDGRPSD